MDWNEILVNLHGRPLPEEKYTAEGIPVLRQTTIDNTMDSIGLDQSYFPSNFVSIAEENHLPAIFAAQYSHSGAGTTEEKQRILGGMILMYSLLKNQAQIYLMNDMKES